MNALYAERRPYTASVYLDLDAIVQKISGLISEKNFKQF